MVLNRRSKVPYIAGITGFAGGGKPMESAASVLGWPPAGFFGIAEDRSRAFCGRVWGVEYGWGVVFELFQNPRRYSRGSRVVADRFDHGLSRLVGCLLGVERLHVGGQARDRWRQVPDVHPIQQRVLKLVVYVVQSSFDEGLYQGFAGVEAILVGVGDGLQRRFDSCGELLPQLSGELCDRFRSTCPL